MFFRFQTLALKFRVTQTVAHPDSGILFGAKKNELSSNKKHGENLSACY